MGHLGLASWLWLQLAYNNVEIPDIARPDGHTAIYDISAHIVYLPSGERLEAHSGFGRMLDDPRYVAQRTELHDLLKQCCRKICV